jgi:hypothetical protein
MFGHALDQAALFGDHLVGACDVPGRLGKMVMLGCHDSAFVA